MNDHLLNNLPWEAASGFNSWINVVIWVGLPLLAWTVLMGHYRRQFSPRLGWEAARSLRWLLLWPWWRKGSPHLVYDTTHHRGSSFEVIEYSLTPSAPLSQTDEHTSPHTSTLWTLSDGSGYFALPDYSQPRTFTLRLPEVGGFPSRLPMTSQTSPHEWYRGEKITGTNYLGETALIVPVDIPLSSSLPAWQHLADLSSLPTWRLPTLLAVTGIVALLYPSGMNLGVWLIYGGWWSYRWWQSARGSSGTVVTAKGLPLGGAVIRVTPQEKAKKRIRLLLSNHRGQWALPPLNKTATAQAYYSDPVSHLVKCSSPINIQTEHSLVI